MRRAAVVKVGDLVRHNKGHIGMVTEVRMMYPRHPMSPVDAVKVTWQHSVPDKSGTVLWYSQFAIDKVLSSVK